MVLSGVNVPPWKLGRNNNVVPPGITVPPGKPRKEGFFSWDLCLRSLPTYLPM